VLAGVQYDAADKPVGVGVTKPCELFGVSIVGSTFGLDLDANELAIAGLDEEIKLVSTAFGPEME
jgi:hypothetical protein